MGYHWPIISFWDPGSANNRGRSYTFPIFALLQLLISLSFILNQTFLGSLWKDFSFSVERLCVIMVNYKVNFQSWMSKSIFYLLLCIICTCILLSCRELKQMDSSLSAPIIWSFLIWELLGVFSIVKLNTCETCDIQPHTVTQWTEWFKLCVIGLCRS